MGPLAHGAVLIPYRVENLRILPVLGASALSVSPRVGHLHVTVDDLPWHWGDFSDSNTIVVVGLPPGQHKVLIELADPEHRIFTGQSATLVVPPQDQWLRPRAYSRYVGFCSTSPVWDHMAVTTA